MERANNTNEAARDGEPFQSPGRDAESWVDAVVTLLGTILFGLAWVLVELERAEPVQNGYDAAISRTWIAADTESIELAVADPIEGRDQR